MRPKSAIAFLEPRYPLAPVSAVVATCEGCFTKVFATLSIVVVSFSSLVLSSSAGVSSAGVSSGVSAGVSSAFGSSVGVSGVSTGVSSTCFSSGVVVGVSFSISTPFVDFASNTRASLLAPRVTSETSIISPPLTTFESKLYS